MDEFKRILFILEVKEDGEGRGKYQSGQLGRAVDIEEKVTGGWAIGRRGEKKNKKKNFSAAGTKGGEGFTSQLKTMYLRTSAPPYVFLVRTKSGASSTTNHCYLNTKAAVSVARFKHQAETSNSSLLKAFGNDAGALQSLPPRRERPFLNLYQGGFKTTSISKMPTPESAAFLAKKPTVPPTFDGVDYDDNKRLKQAQDAIIREQWVQVMMGRLVREELGKCYTREGVNHLEKCGALRGQSIYTGMVANWCWNPSQGLHDIPGGKRESIS